MNRAALILGFEKEAQYRKMLCTDEHNILQRSSASLRRLSSIMLFGNLDFNSHQICIRIGT